MGESIIFLGREGKGQQARMARGALRKGGCAIENRASLHLWLLKQADSPLP